MEKNPVMHGKIKHIEIHHHHIRDLVHRGVIKLDYCNTEDQVENIFTKALTKVKHCKFRDMLMMTPNVYYGGVLERLIIHICVEDPMRPRYIKLVS